jgi:effector-binding domain-containing protein
MDPSYHRLFAYLGEVGVPPTGAPFAAYHTMDMQDLDVEVGVPVARPVASAGEVIAAELPARRIATALYTGPYEGLPGFHHSFMAWCNAHGHHLNGPVYEFYMNNPSETPADQLQTRIEYMLGRAD